ncbi:UDP-N-acetylglucosamine 1-carboxyvinyltransferase [Microaerobacter geothermalis]|uniref:UDP-N-acetylglucosamine 1-carboxyvinyltransferase n=1 Tax=Microaerobacter geothermalis TaxID=674972 RepID=UPI001F2BF599|nr:UDP-N-acetylglucosamine 1-carboxyvinyltransferase [Microaerobacter geothermalis]MCF6093607.1 UDP-N-acetylglucosamine 1-carboxyvinyltransferase [Microaerobacter geothermalis]
MEAFIIEGGKPLSGKVRVHGAKNASLPIFSATLLAKGKHIIREIPQLLDIYVMLDILKRIGARCKVDSSKVIIDTSGVNQTDIPEDLMGQMRSSIFLMGPLLARFGRVTVTRPGGCAIGERRIDLHLKGLEYLGAHIEVKGGYITCSAPVLQGNSIYLDYPSVGATENIMMAAVLAKGKTQIKNAAREPEIIDLQNFLNSMGAKVSGAGTNVIEIEGVKDLRASDYRVIPDRIVTGTFMMAAAITSGEITIENARADHLDAVIDVLRRCGVEISIESDIMKVKGPKRLRSVDRVRTAPYPGFPTDLQAPMMALLSTANGASIVSENVFDSRFKHVNELNRMGANIQVDLNSAFIRGVPYLEGAMVEATDLRAGAALVLAALAAKGVSRIHHIHHIDRGYEKLETYLKQINANMQRVNL